MTLFLPEKRAWADLPNDLARFLSKYLSQPPQWQWPVRSIPPGGENSNYALNIGMYRWNIVEVLDRAKARHRRRLCRVRLEIRK